ncbi:hypothetical protein WN982_10195 [Paraburkholderia sp. IMGN_8]|uniref:hypothetical protein n=1 Tax=Paraburkholderia sp. IMGN_8 TaxID=3136564 RepID=UPI003100A9D9
MQPIFVDLAGFVNPALSIWLWQLSTSSVVPCGRRLDYNASRHRHRRRELQCCYASATRKSAAYSRSVLIRACRFAF